MSEEDGVSAVFDDAPGARDVVTEVGRRQALLQTGALQSAIFYSANFSSIATDAKGVIQLFNVGADRLLGYTAAEVGLSCRAYPTERKQARRGLH